MGNELMCHCISILVSVRRAKHGFLHIDDFAHCLHLPLYIYTLQTLNRLKVTYYGIRATAVAHCALPGCHTLSNFQSQVKILPS